MAVPPGMKQCDDLLMFQSALKEMRLIDDKIVYALNNSIPTVSFKGQVNATNTCKDLHGQIDAAYDLREGALNSCVQHLQDRVSKAVEDNNRSAKRQAQTLLRLYKNELSVEEVIRQRTKQIFYEKCRDHLAVDGTALKMPS